MVDRREFLKAGLTGGVAASLGGGLFAKADDSDETDADRSDGPPPLDHPRPNILWITAEDISPDLGCYGDDYAVTPNLDRLAAQGTRFDRAFAPAGVCAPARSAIITGMYPTSIGTHNMRCKGVLPPAVRCFTETLREGGYYCSNRSKTDYQFDAPPAAWDDCSRRAHWRGRADGQPFFSVINITTTHESKIRSKARKLLDRLGTFAAVEKHDPARAEIPPYYPDTAAVRKDWARYADLVTLMDREVGAILDDLESDGLAGETIVWFFGDHGRGLPRAKRWIYDSGIHVPFIVRVPGKYRGLAHGDDPAALAPGTVWDDLVSFVDFAPTMLSLTGGRVPDHMQGKAFFGGQKRAPRKYVFAARDRMDEAYDLIRAVRDKRFKYIRNFMPHITRGQDIEYMNEMPTMRAMRQLHGSGALSGPALDYFRESKPIEELYDTEADPHEIDNLAGRGEYGEVLLRLRGALDEWMGSIVDVGLIPEPDLDELMRPGGGSRIEPRWKEAITGDRFERIVEVSRLAEKGAGALGSLVEALDDRDGAVRYWAALGLLRLRDAKDLDRRLIEIAKGKLVLLLGDRSPAVAVAAAEACLTLGGDGGALQVLIETLDRPSESAKLFAVAALGRLGEKARPALGRLESVAGDGRGYAARAARPIVRALSAIGADNNVGADE